MARVNDAATALSKAARAFAAREVDRARAEMTDAEREAARAGAESVRDGMKNDHVAQAEIERELQEMNEEIRRETSPPNVR